MISPRLCIKCKGKLLCGMKYCSILEKHSTHKRVTEAIKGNEFAGNSPPGVFVSWYSYPKISVAPLSPSSLEHNAGMLDEPEQWFGLPQEKIVNFRQSLIRSSKKFSVTEAADPTYSLQSIQELTMSRAPVQVEVSLFKKPVLKNSFNDIVAPMGPEAPLKKLSLSENPKIHKKVDYLTSDIDVKSQTAIMELYHAGLPVSYLYKILSAGTLGVQKSRRLVPTRFAITAVDDVVSKELIQEIKDYNEVNEIQLFKSSYLDNSFFVLLIPHSWAFEQLECWLPKGIWTEKADSYHIIQDHEFYSGRKRYADNVTGAYYSARLAVLEHLKEEKRQAAVIVFREIGQEYGIPLGVWVIRETVRDAMKRKPLTFFNLEIALKFISKKTAVPLGEWSKNSKILDFIWHQRSLKDYSGN